MKVPDAPQLPAGFQRQIRHHGSMITIPVSVNDDFAALLRAEGSSPPAAALELMALELYRRGVVSGGKAAEWLGTSKQDFVQHASRLGIPALQMSEDEWEAESKLAGSL